MRSFNLTFILYIFFFYRWKNFKRQMLSMRSHSDSKGFELKRASDSIYTFPCPDCMCHTNKTEDSRSSSATWFYSGLSSTTFSRTISPPHTSRGLNQTTWLVMGSLRILMEARPNLTSYIASQVWAKGPLHFLGDMLMVEGHWNCQISRIHEFLALTENCFIFCTVNKRITGYLLWHT